MESLDDTFEFDSDLPPDSEHNRRVAERKGLVYDSNKKAYVDEDGCLIRDRYGQPF